MYRDTEQRDFARNLRTNMTDAERRLWGVLRCEQLKDYKSRRQAAIGEYIVDSVCFPKKLVIELDGGQHNEEMAKAHDANRSAWLNSQGFRVVRFWNHEVFENLDGVVEVIWRSLEVLEQAAQSSPSPTLPAEGRV